MEDEEVDNLLTRDREKSINMRDDLVDYLDEVIVTWSRWNLTSISRSPTNSVFSWVSWAILPTYVNWPISVFPKFRELGRTTKSFGRLSFRRPAQWTDFAEESSKLKKIFTFLIKSSKHTLIYRKLKRLEDWFMNQVHAKGKITALNQYP